MVGSAKGDWDVGITIDVLDAAARVDEVALASGDGDFDFGIGVNCSSIGLTLLIG